MDTKDNLVLPQSLIFKINSIIDKAQSTNVLKIIIDKTRIGKVSYYFKENKLPWDVKRKKMKNAEFSCCCEIAGIAQFTAKGFNKKDAKSKYFILFRFFFYV